MKERWCKIDNLQLDGASIIIGLRRFRFSPPGEPKSAQSRGRKGTADLLKIYKTFNHTSFMFIRMSHGFATVFLRAGVLLQVTKVATPTISGAASIFIAHDASLDKVSLGSDQLYRRGGMEGPSAPPYLPILRLAHHLTI